MFRIADSAIPKTEACEALLPYWLLFTMSAVGAFQSRAYVHQLGRIGPVLAVFAIIVSLMVGLRFEVGGDWGAYIDIFDFMRYRDLNSAVAYGDPGYSVLNWLAWRMGVGIWFVNFVCALVFTWGLHRFAADQPSPWLALVVAIPYLVIVVAMGYTRQAVAIGLALASISQLRRNGSMVRFILLIALAATFHRSVIVLVPMVALARTRNRWMMIAMGALLMAALFYVFVSARLDVMIANYEGQDYDAQGALVRVLMNVMPGVIFLLFQKRLSLDEEDRRLWRNFSIAAIVTLVMLRYLESSVVVDRLALYLIPLQLAVFARMPFAASRSEAPSGLITLLVIVYSAVIQYVWLNFADHAYAWVPYRWYPFAG